MITTFQTLDLYFDGCILGPMITLHCQICRTPKQVSNSKRQTFRFCSRTCLARHKTNEALRLRPAPEHLAHGSVRLPLRGGSWTLIDAADLDWAAALPWFVNDQNYVLTPGR